MIRALPTQARPSFSASAGVLDFKASIPFQRDAAERLTAGVPWLLGAYITAWTIAAIAIGQLHTFSGMRFDTYEMLLMGHEWQFAYWKHPALPPWITEAVFVATGHSVYALAVLPVLWVAWALWLVDRLCRPIFGAAGAAVATALSMGSWYIMTVVGHFNHNIAQLPFWALAVILYRRAILKPSYGAWIGLAISAALLLQTKYTGALLLGTLAVHALCFPQGRRALRTPQAWAGIAVAFALVAPQALQLLLRDRSALAYAVHDRQTFSAWYDYLLGPLGLLGSQLLFHIAIAAIALAAYPFRLKDRARAVVVALPGRSEFDTTLLIASTAAPLVLGAIFYALVGVWGRSEAFGSMFILAGPSMVACTGRFIRIAHPRVVIALCALVLFLPPIGNILDPILGPAVFHRIGTEQIPFHAGIAPLMQRWQRYTTQPLMILAGEHRVAGGFAAFMEPRPSVLIDGMTGRSPWITPQMIRTQGAMIVWRVADARQAQPPAALLAPLSSYRLRVLEPLRLATVWDRSIAPVQFGVAIILPVQNLASAKEKTRTNPGL